MRGGGVEKESRFRREMMLEWIYKKVISLMGLRKSLLLLFSQKWKKLFFHVKFHLLLVENFSFFVLSPRRGFYGGERQNREQ